ncbi:DUF2510 domain-containing protein [Rhodococcus oryzae]|uniref:DUF2510 domain-containing protein n=1 Tax=Rhodococcus oryzae TaxID=2571143 RepID=A0ABY2RSC0_9NOCA|nr:DUF2510 domain-containing protein [Rhodococcus oryzae]
MLPPAGWHPDPYDPSASERYWDGERWTDQVRPRVASIGVKKKHQNWPWLVGAAVVAFIAFGAMTDGGDTGSDAGTTVTATVQPVSSTPQATTTARTVPPSSQPATVPVSPVVESTPQRPITTEPTLSLEASCSDSEWRESMGLEGDRLCGSTWVPRNQPPAPAPLFSPPTTTVAPAPAPVYSPPAVERSGGTVHPGSFCSTPGATGVTTKGKSMVCDVASDGKDRWQSAY